MKLTTPYRLTQKNVRKFPSEQCASYACTLVLTTLMPYRHSLRDDKTTNRTDTQKTDYTKTSRAL